MKSNTSRNVLTLAIGGIGLLSASAQAGQLWWDTSDDPGLQGGAGIWNVADTNWNPVADGSGARQGWVIHPPNGAGVTDGIFDVPGTATQAFGIRALSLTFNADTTVVNSSLAKLNVDNDITVASGVTAAIHRIDGATPTSDLSGLNKAGLGTLILDAIALSSASEPTWLKAGTLKLGTPDAGEGFSFGKSLRVDPGATLDLNNNVMNAFGTPSGIIAYALRGDTHTTGGTITNTGDTVVNFITSPDSGIAESGSFGATITGNINLVKTTGRTMFLNRAHTYVGSTRLAGTGGGFRCAVTNALPIHTDLIIDVNRDSAAAQIAFQFPGRNQEIGALHDVGTTAPRIVEHYATGAVTATLTINGQTYVNGVLTDTDSDFSGVLRDNNGDGTKFGKLALAITGNSTVTLRGDNTYTGGTSVNGGTLVFSTRIPKGSVSVDYGTLRVTAKGTPNDPTGTSVITSLALTGSNLDLTNNSMVVDFSGAAGTLEDDVRQHLYEGRLTSSVAGTPAGTKLGYGDNSVLGQTSFAGQTVDADSMLIKFTYAGDANLDGQVTISDLGDLASNWQSTTAVWRNGDFNYDGAVTISDLGDLASNWQAGVGSPLGMSFQQAMAAVGLGGVPVPEPTMMTLIGLCLASVSTRTRRK